MITRISTPAQHAAAITKILERQVALSKTQVQLATGKRIQNPSEDPIAATRILGVERAQAQLAQYASNADMAASRLGSGEQAFTDLGTLLDRVQVLVVQANSGSMDDSSLASIATELRARAADLLQIANRQDGNGEYLFAGYATTIRPFAQGGSYQGDQGVRQLQVSATQKVADGFNGQQVFLDIPGGNGRFAVATGVRSGTGVVGVNQVVDQGAWSAAAAQAAAVPQPHAYTIRFTDPDATGAARVWEVLDAGGTQVATGAYADGGTIGFDGAQVTLTGAPAAGDTFTIAPAGSESLFRTLDDLVAALGRSADSPVSRAELNTSLNRALTQLARASDHITNLRAQTGARLSTLDTAAALREDLGAQLSETLSGLQDLDYAEAISRMNQQAAGLQAAQAAYTRIGQMSLFDYL